MPQQVFAFANITDTVARQRVYSELQIGTARFGMWNQGESLLEKSNGPNQFLLRIQAQDWLVYVNCPEYGKCTAVQTVGTYQFDGGIDVAYGNGKDFHNCLPVDPATVITFDRNDPNVLRSVNLAPRKRAQRVLAVTDFLTTLEHLRANKFTSHDEGLRGLVHIREKMDKEILPRMTAVIQEMNRGKDFERFLNRIFNEMPNVKSFPNGFGWKTDSGADLIVEFKNPVVDLYTRLVVQAKSYKGDHNDLHAVDQIEKGMRVYDADSGLLISTGVTTDALEEKVRQVAEKTGKTIDIIAGADVARFVLTHSPHLLIGKSLPEKK